MTQVKFGSAQTFRRQQVSSYDAALDPTVAWRGTVTPFPFDAFGIFISAPLHGA